MLQANSVANFMTEGLARLIDAVRAVEDSGSQHNNAVSTHFPSAFVMCCGADSVFVVEFFDKVYIEGAIIT